MFELRIIFIHLMYEFLAIMQLNKEKKSFLNVMDKLSNIINCYFIKIKFIILIFYLSLNVLFL